MKPRILDIFSASDFHCWDYNSEMDDRLHLPRPNPFVPTDFNLIQAVPEKTVPSLVLDENIMEMWHVADVSFNVPKAVVYLSIESPRCTASPEDSVLCK